MHEKLTQTWIDCLAPSGMRIAVLHLMADGTISPTPLTMLDEIEAVRRGEPAVQLRESAHYEYTLESTHGVPVLEDSEPFSPFFRRIQRACLDFVTINDRLRVAFEQRLGVFGPVFV